MDNPFKSPTIISFCPGILGIERGLTRAGVHCRVAAYVEIEAAIIGNLVAGMEAGMVDPAPIWTDAKTFDARRFRGRIHGIVGGYPCTPFSLAGPRTGEDHPGHIYPSISRALETTGAIWAFFENVDDHLTLGFDKVYQDLENMGYSVETRIITAEEVGAPHERGRMFTLAVANSDCYGYGARAGAAVGKSGQVEGETQRKEWSDLLREWLWDVLGNSGQKLGYSSGFSEREQANEAESFTDKGGAWDEPSYASQLAHSQCQGLEERGEQPAREEQQTPKRGSVITRWPARPGEEQYNWEEPRTIESSVGCTINGYNYREDLLRALGNSVVEQCAEIAFLDLIKKHLKNLQ